MPAKTGKKSVKFNKSNRINKKRTFIIIGFITIIGVLVLFRANAATNNFETESVSKNTLVATGTDSLASGGKYVEFAQPTTSTVSNQRFPGDPNPLKNGKAYWGAAIQGNGDPKRHELVAGKSLSIRRTYYDWAGRQKMIDTARADIAANRLPFVSTKTPGWTEMASGKRDTEIDDTLRKLDALGSPVWLVFHHEPEGGCNNSCKGPKGEDDVAGAAGWLSMQKHIRSRMNAVGTKNIAFVANLMAWTFNSQSNRNPNDWWADNVWDVYTADAYCDGGGCLDGQSSVTDTKSWKAYEAFASSKNIPMGVGEWGDRGESIAAGKDIQKTWEYGFTNKKDIVAWSYFDSNLNSDSGGWELKGYPLTQFQQIINEDNRVMRISDLNKASTTKNNTTNYGKVTGTVTIPTNGIYNVWVRMKALDTTSNSAQLQIDNGSAYTIGGSKISGNTNWTWVSIPSVTISAGERTIGITGTQRGVKIDRVIVASQSCTPVGTGDLCANLSSPPVQKLNVVVSGITNGGTATGIIPIKVKADRAIAAVSFRPDNIWAAYDETSPFEFNWDTRSLSNGAHTLVIRTRAEGDPGDVYTQTVINVTVNNTVSVAPPPAPQDTVKPSIPVGLKAYIRFDWTKMKYVMNIKWGASSDNVAVTRYKINRNASFLGSTTKLSFVDSTNLSSGATYTYSVKATDAANNNSGPASISITTNCVLSLCTATVK